MTYRYQKAKRPLIGGMTLNEFLGKAEGLFQKSQSAKPSAERVLAAVGSEVAKVELPKLAPRGSLTDVLNLASQFFSAKGAELPGGKLGLAPFLPLAIKEITGAEPKAGTLDELLTVGTEYFDKADNRPPGPPMSLNGMLPRLTEFFRERIAQLPGTGTPAPAPGATAPQTLPAEAERGTAFTVPPRAKPTASSPPATTFANLEAAVRNEDFWRRFADATFGPSTSARALPNTFVGFDSGWDQARGNLLKEAEASRKFAAEMERREKEKQSPAAVQARVDTLRRMFFRAGVNLPREFYAGLEIGERDLADAGDRLSPSQLTLAQANAEQFIRAASGDPQALRANTAAAREAVGFLRAQSKSGKVEFVMQ